jgi:hypothetical protein
MRETLGFAFDRAASVVLAPLGIRPETAYVRIDDEAFTVRFGRWSLQTPKSNVVEARVTGPYRWYRAIGVRLSLADRGATFGTNAWSGLCVCFAEPVPAVLPGSLLRHPALTVTVQEPERLRRLLAR